MSYLRLRSECEFSGCGCIENISTYNRNGIEVCDNCGHGSCWHKLLSTSKSQFTSSRSCARIPYYSSNKERGDIPMQVFTPVPPIPIAVAVPVYCASVELLPI